MVNLRANPQLEETSWLDAVLGRSPNFTTAPPPMLQTIQIDLVALSPRSQQLCLTLARRTIDLSTSTCIDLNSRGIREEELLALMPHLLKACQRRHAVGKLLHQTVQGACPESEFAQRLRAIHAHKLLPGRRGEGGCHLCGKANIAGASTPGYLCRKEPGGPGAKNLINDADRPVEQVLGKWYCRGPSSVAAGPAVKCRPDGAQCGSCKRFESAAHLDPDCDFFVCHACVEFITQGGAHRQRLVDASGQRLEFRLDAGCLSLEVEGETVAPAVTWLRYDCLQRTLAVADATFSFEQLAGFIPALERLAAQAIAPAVEWKGDEPGKPRCCVCAHVMLLRAHGGDSPPERTCVECGSRQAGEAWTCGGCKSCLCLACSPLAISGASQRAASPAASGCMVFLDLRGNPVREVPEDLQQLVTRLGGAILFDGGAPPPGELVLPLGASAAEAGLEVQQGAEDVGTVTRRLMEHGQYRFSGELNAEGREHGVGTRFYAEGCAMVATWVDGKRCGKVVCTWPDGAKWEVHCERDEVGRSAQGLLSCGDRFEGEVKELQVLFHSKHGPKGGDRVKTTSDVRGAPPGVCL
jgi:hypothetical protein